MTSEIIFIVEESLDGGYEAKALEYSIYTQAESYEEIKELIKDAVKCHFSSDSMPHIIRLHFVKDEVLAV